MKIFSLFAIILAFICIRANLMDLDELEISSDLIGDQFNNGTIIEELIRNQIDEIKSNMINGDSDNGILTLDPYHIVKSNFDIKASFANLKVKVNDVKVSGLSKFNLTQLSVDVENKSISLELEVPQLKISGMYKTSGISNMFGKVNIDGMGHFKASLTKPSIKIVFMINKENGTNDISVSGSSVSVDYEHFDFKLEGFMPGHPQVPAFLTAIKAKSRAYFEERREELEDEISQVMSSTLNSMFDDILNQQDQPEEDEEESHVISKRRTCGSVNMNSVIDKVLKTAQPLIKTKADPLKLKSFKKVVKFYNGNVRGLSTIRRTGNVGVSCSSSTITLRVNFGFGHISAGYKWSKKVLFVNKKGSVKIRFHHIEFSAKISQSRKSYSHPVIKSLDISIKGIKVHLTGFSIFGHIVASVISLISNIFRKAIINAIEKPIRTVLQKLLNKITLPF